MIPKRTYRVTRTELYSGDVSFQPQIYKRIDFDEGWVDLGKPVTSLKSAVETIQSHHNRQVKSCVSVPYEDLSEAPDSFLLPRSTKNA